MPDLDSADLARCRARLIDAGAELEALRADAVGGVEHDMLDTIDRHITSALARLREYERRAGLNGDSNGR